MPTSVKGQLLYSLYYISQHLFFQQSIGVYWRSAFIWGGLLFSHVKSTYVSGLEKRGNFAQKLVFHLSSIHNSALFKLHYVLCLKLLAAYVSKKQLHESQTHTESNFEKLASKDWLPGKINWIPYTAQCKFSNAPYKVMTQSSILQTSPEVR